MAFWKPIGASFAENQALRSWPADPDTSRREKTQAAEHVFSDLKAQLDPESYSLVCEGFFIRWKGIVQQLKDDE
jgi:hypothetical protein